MSDRQALDLWTRKAPIEERRDRYERALQEYEAGERERRPVPPRDPNDHPYSTWDAEAALDDVKHLPGCPAVPFDPKAMPGPCPSGPEGCGSRHDLTHRQRPGPDRPFLISFARGPSEKDCTIFRDDPELRRMSNWRERPYNATKGAQGCAHKAFSEMLRVDRTKHSFGCHDESCPGCSAGASRTKWKERAPYGGWIFLTWNGAKFDHLLLLKWLRAHRHLYVSKVTKVGAEVIEVRVETVRRSRESGQSGHRVFRWTFRDVKKLLPMSQDQAAKAYGVELKVPIDMHTHEDDPIWEDRARGDAIGAWKIYSKARELIVSAGGVVKLTTASTAITLLESRFMGGPYSKTEDKGEVIINRNRHLPACTEARASYAEQEAEWKANPWTFDTHGRRWARARPRVPAIVRACDKGAKEDEHGEPCLHRAVRSLSIGGHTECYDLGATVSGNDGRCHVFDAVAMYGWAETQDLPYGRAFERKEYERERHGAGFVGFFWGVVDVPEMHVPPLPIRFANGIVFPVGRIAGGWSSEEINLLLDVGGRIVETDRVLWYPARPWMKPYVQEHWKLRDKSREDWTLGKDQQGKLFINSPFGRTMMRPNRELTIVESIGGKDSCVVCNKKFDRWTCERHTDIHDEGREKCLGYHRFPVAVGEGEVGDDRLCRACRKLEMSGVLSPVAPTGADALTMSSTGLWTKKHRSKALSIVPQVGATILAYGRSRLYRRILTHPAVERLYYTDTDSGFVKLREKYDGKPGYEAFNPSKVLLGEPKDEYPDRQVVFSGLTSKVYQLSELDGTVIKTVVKGVEGAEHARMAFGTWGPLISMGGILPKDDDSPARKAATLNVPAWEREGALRRRGYSEGPRAIERKKSPRTPLWKRILYADGGTDPLRFDVRPPDRGAGETERVNVPVGDSLRWLITKGVVDAKGRPVTKKGDTNFERFDRPLTKDEDDNLSEDDEAAAAAEE